MFMVNFFNFPIAKCITVQTAHVVCLPGMSDK